MSLKEFHLLFIVVSILLAIGLGIRTLLAYLDQNAWSLLGWSLLSFAAAAALIVYGVHIFRKLRNVGSR